VAELPSVRLNDVRITDDLVHTHDRMLTGGFYAELDLTYDPSIAEEKSGRPFGIESLREIQLSKRDVLETLCKGRTLFTFKEWRDLLLRSVGLEPSVLGDRTCDVMLCFAWSRSLKTITMRWNWVHAEPARAIFTSRCHPMRILFQVPRPLWPRCL